MESLYLLIPIAILIVAVAVAVFFWAVKSGQYDDLDTEGHRILFDDDDIESNRARAAKSALDTKGEPRL
ncbi:cbb3-type cytochrome oxidase assembly protein CcoS [Marinagarivorans cellulosilyticus]|uniref:Cbb3-type cytochrome oxidase assembly protein CcoS n=1 Tax=Marinagarivorans cellulosilyticus TaxID=2721545 RepID=A0AAN1WKX4_9GAMM|nr:cbb3-type cytochrome oxidase assembly protein CcoS [Marinagarivorans cellulosilyticus]BCD99474.1 hypothetical protein MARGE09_P3676 [Marinagarivorans cellulosilyticus]